MRSSLPFVATSRKTARSVYVGTLLTLPLVFTLPLQGFAGTVSVLNEFVNGEEADADEVNANFDAIETAVNDNDARITGAVSTANDASLAAAAAQAAADAAAAVDFVDTNTQLTCSQVDDCVANNGFADQTSVSANTGLIEAQAAQITALQAQIAQLISLVRFEACPDGLTVADHSTGLLWERKSGAVGDPIECDDTPGGCADIHNVNNIYAWDNTGASEVDTEFLDSMNASGFAGHGGWRLPKLGEMQTIMVGEDVVLSIPNIMPYDPDHGQNTTGQPQSCSFSPCMDPRFSSVGGPTAPARYWTGSFHPEHWNYGLHVNFAIDGGVGLTLQHRQRYVRAVRAGSCTE